MKFIKSLVIGVLMAFPIFYTYHAINSDGHTAVEKINYATDIVLQSKKDFLEELSHE